MPYEFHINKPEYFNMQYLNSQNYIIPFISNYLPIQIGMHVLEIGCAEGGVLKAFTDLGCVCTGIELSPSRLEFARQFFPEELQKGVISFISRDVYDIDPEKDFTHKFDIIILKDVIEHIHDQEKLIRRLQAFLNPAGVIFFGFPPWQMPFGGHQQLCDNKFARLLPYYHLFPAALYKAILNMLGETQIKISALLEIKETGLSLERFEQFIKQNEFSIVQRQLFLINPIYRYKFNLKPIRQFRWLVHLPWIRNFFTTAAYYLIIISRKQIR